MEIQNHFVHPQTIYEKTSFDPRNSFRWNHARTDPVPSWCAYWLCGRIAPLLHTSDLHWANFFLRAGSYGFI